jgi:hypothetical protein
MVGQRQGQTEKKKSHETEEREGRWREDEDRSGEESTEVARVWMMDRKGRDVEKVTKG